MHDRLQLPKYSRPMPVPAILAAMSAIASGTMPDAHGHFGPYGGRYVPETLMHPLQELEAGYFRSHDPEFQRELQYYLREFCGRPTPLYFAERLTRELGGAKIYLKREDLLHTGAHKINNAMGQILLAKRMGRTAHHRRDRCGATRRRDGNCVGHVWFEVCHLYGRSGLRTTIAKRLSHEDARRGSRVREAHSLRRP